MRAIGMMGTGSSRKPLIFSQGGFHSKDGTWVDHLHHRAYHATEHPGDTDFIDGLQSALAARISKRMSPGTGGTGSSGQEDCISNGSDHRLNVRLRGINTTVSSDISQVLQREAGFCHKVDPSSERSCMINPRAPQKIVWDVFVGVLILYTIILLPWRIGFDQDATGAAQVFDYILDFLFFVDMTLCFRTGYFDSQDSYVCDPALIAKRYLRGFFLPDFLSCLPMDLLMEVFSGESGGSASRSIKVMKFVRLVRLMKLMRLFKLERFLIALEHRLDLNPHAIRMAKLLIQIVFLAHLLCCCWHFIALPICGDHNIAEPCPAPTGGATANVNWVRQFDVDHFDPFSRYIASFHFVTATMMAVGYGDIFPTTTIERIFSICTQLLGASAFGFILSAVTALLDSAHPRDSEHKKRMTEVKEWLSGRHLPKALRRAVREHFNYALSKKSIFNEADILGNVPSQLKNLIVRQSYTKWIDTLEKIFPKEDPSLCADLIISAKPMQISPDELVLEAGEISMEVFFVMTGRLGVYIDATGLFQPETKWTRQCLMQSEAARKLTRQRQCRSTGSFSVDIDDDWDIHSPHELFCGYIDKNEMWGVLVACPLNAVGQTRSEILIVQKDTFLPMLHRCPGAAQRYARTEIELTREVNLVLESPQASEDAGLEFPSKSMVLSGGKATKVQLALTKFGRARTASSLYSRRTSRSSYSSCEARRTRQSLSTSRRETHPRTCMGFLHDMRRSKCGFGNNFTVLHTLRIRPGESDIFDGDETEGDLLARFIIPPFHRHKFKWDVFVGALICYSVLVIPYRIGFGVEATGGWLVWDWATDACFAMDMLLCFRTAFVDDNGLTNTVPSLIQRQYLSSWFAIDFFSTFPLDRIVEASVSGGVGAQARALKLIRIVRLVRLLKLARLLKMGRLMRTFEEVAELSPIAVRCLKLGSRLAVMAHLLGCFWYYTSVQPDKSVPPCDWGMLFCDDAIKSETWWQALGITENQTWEQYIAAIYWSFTTMTTVGYGDVTPKSDYERIYAIVSMVFGATIFGYIVGSIATLAGNDAAKGGMSSGGAVGESSKMKKRIAMIRDFCEEQDLPKKQQEMVKHHYQFYYSQKWVDEDAILQDLPTSLRKQVIFHIHREAIGRLGLFHGAELLGLSLGPLPVWFTALVVRLLEPQVVAAGEDVISSCSTESYEIFFVSNGECEAYIPRGKRERQRNGYQCDTGGSGDVGGTSSHDDDAEIEVSSRCRKDRTVMVFTVGCMFGLEHLFQHDCKYLVKAAGRSPAFLYALKQSTVTEASRYVPELSGVIRAAVTTAFIQQTRSGIPHSNLESRRLKTRHLSQAEINRQSSHSSEPDPE